MNSSRSLFPFLTQYMNVVSVLELMSTRYLYISVYFIVLKIKLANSTEAEINTFKSSLHSYRDETDGDLKKNVFRKYVFSFLSMPWSRDLLI